MKPYSKYMPWLNGQRWQGGKLIFRRSVAFSSTAIPLILQGIGSRSLPPSASHLLDFKFLDAQAPSMTWRSICI